VPGHLLKPPVTRIQDHPIITVHLNFTLFALFPPVIPPTWPFHIFGVTHYNVTERGSGVWKRAPTFPFVQTCGNHQDVYLLTNEKIEGIILVVIRTTPKL
jgi:hypothetical protein